MLLQRLHFLRKLIPHVTVYKLKERVESSTRSFGFCSAYSLILHATSATYND